MKFGGLSQKEVQAISEILTQDSIEFNVITDEEIWNANKESLKNDIRHFSSPSVSTHILAIEISEEAFQNLSQNAKENLLEYGITNEIPSDLDLNEMVENPVEELQAHNTKGNRAIVGVTFGLEIIIAAFILLASLYAYLK